MGNPTSDMTSDSALPLVIRICIVQRVEYDRLRLCFTTCDCHSRMILWEISTSQSDHYYEHICGTICDVDRGSLERLFNSNDEYDIRTTHVPVHMKMTRLSFKT